MKKLKVLCWSDATSVHTGFGIVSRHVINGLYKTGLYEIDHLAINYHGDFLDKNQIPWQVVPAKLGDPSDPHGTHMFLKAVNKQDYDYIWILNDTYITHRATKTLQQIFDKKILAGKKLPIIIYYYPVDFKVDNRMSSMVTFADIPVAYNDYGYQETLNTYPDLDRVKIVPHGVDTDVFKPLPARVQPLLKKKYFKLDPDTFLVTNINRNSPRKQITRTLLAFKEFKKLVPKSVLYLHTEPVEPIHKIDLLHACQELEFTERDVAFPANYSPSKGLPDGVLNEILNASDVYLTNHLGEGWGLGISDAMGAGTPVVVPDNTCMPEIVGPERGYMYPCKEKIVIDLAGYRPLGLITDVVEQLAKVYKEGSKYRNPKVMAARSWAEQHTWQHVARQWVELFKTARPIDRSGYTKPTDAIIEEV